MSRGYQAVPVTTHALANLFQAYLTYNDAIGWGYQQDNHYFYVITFPTQGVSYCYDLTTGKWHQRAGFYNGQLTRDWANCCVSWNGNNIIGDYASGNIYILDPNNYTDNGIPRKWVRTWKALPPSTPSDVAFSFNQLQIMLETGITVPIGTNPIIMLRWSDDGGYTWTSYFEIQAGMIGQTTWRALWTRLGSTKIGTGLDRVFEISGTDPIAIKITGCNVEVSPS